MPPTETFACEAASATVWPYSFAFAENPVAGAVAAPVAAPPVEPVVESPVGMSPVVPVPPVPVVPIVPPPVPKPPVVWLSGLFCDMLFRLLQQMIKDRSKMKAREGSLPEKSFSRRGGAILVPTSLRRGPRGKSAAEAARACAPPPRSNLSVLLRKCTG